MHSNIDVLIIGGGPTGTMLALELALHKVSLRIVDKEPLRSDKSRALVLHPRTLELLSRHRNADELIPLGKLAMSIRIFVNKAAAVGIDLDDLGFEDTAFTVPLFISQAETERFLDKALLRYGPAVERSVTVQEVLDEGERVLVKLRGADGAEEQVSCKYVVGCDGAHSLVRHAANLTFEGAAYPQDFILADVHVDWDYPQNRLVAFMGQTLMLGFPLGDGVFRLIGGRPGGHDANSEPSLADFQNIVYQLVPKNPKLSDPVWISRFRLHHRGANAYRSGRLFVAGDAAHIHSPAGGQGMNTGLGDAVNLGWKLALVLHNKKPDSFLDSYDAERRPIGEHLLRYTDRLFQFMSTANPVLIFLRNLLVPWIMPWLLRNKSRRARAFRFVSQLGIRYRNSPIVSTHGEYRGPIRGGDRAPDGKLRGDDGDTSLYALCVGPLHHLMVFSGTGTNVAEGDYLNRAMKLFVGANEGLVEGHIIVAEGSVGHGNYADEEGKLHARYGFTEPGCALIRPDCHLGWIGPFSEIDQLKI